MRLGRYTWGDRREGGPEFEPQEISNCNCFFFSNQPTDPELLSGMAVKQLLQFSEVALVKVLSLPYDTG